MTKNVDIWELPDDIKEAKYCPNCAYSNVAADEMTHCPMCGSTILLILDADDERVSNGKKNDGES